MRALFNTRIQLVLGIMQVKLSLLYCRKQNLEDGEKCFKNFESCYQKDGVKKAINMLQDDQELAPFITELKVHLY